MSDLDFKGFFDRISSIELDVTQQSRVRESESQLSNDALFQLPLLAIAILVLSSLKSKPKLDELGQLIGECFERSFEGFKGSSQGIGWSANLRTRTVRALTFLEVAELCFIDQADKRIKATDLGKKVSATARSTDDDLALALAKIERSYNEVRRERDISGTLL